MDDEEFLLRVVADPSLRTWDLSVAEADLAAPEHVFAIIWMVESEINNGGFAQFYHNEVGNLAGLAPVALRAVGAMRSADLIEQANAVFGAHGPARERLVRQVALEGIDGRTRELWEKLEAAFLHDPDGLAHRLVVWVRLHRARFATAPGADGAAGNEGGEAS